MVKIEKVNGSPRRRGHMNKSDGGLKYIPPVPARPPYYNVFVSLAPAGMPLVAWVDTRGGLALLTAGGRWGMIKL